MLRMKPAESCGEVASVATKALARARGQIARRSPIASFPGLRLEFVERFSVSGAYEFNRQCLHPSVRFLYFSRLRRSRAGLCPRVCTFSLSIGCGSRLAGELPSAAPVKGLCVYLYVFVCVFRVLVFGCVSGYVPCACSTFVLIKSSRLKVETCRVFLRFCARLHISKSARRHF